MKKLFIESFNYYTNVMEKNVPNFWLSEGHEHRIKQCNQFINSLNENFKFEKLITLETGSSADYGDGLFGVFLGHATQLMHLGRTVYAFSTICVLNKSPLR